MKKIVYVMDSRVSNTPAELGEDVLEEMERRMNHLREDFCIITTSAMSIERVEMIRRVLGAKDDVVTRIDTTHKANSPKPQKKTSKPVAKKKGKK